MRAPNGLIPASPGPFAWALGLLAAAVVVLVVVVAAGAYAISFRRFQNLRIRFESEVQRQITNAQSLRTQTANARLEADRRVAQTKGAADAKVAEAEGSRRAAFQQSKAYRANPTQRDIDKIRAFCGTDGCDPRVMGGSLDGIIADLSK